MAFIKVLYNYTVRYSDPLRNVSLLTPVLLKGMYLYGVSNINIIDSTDCSRGPCSRFVTFRTRTLRAV